jgi:hypothetical protein
MELGQAEDTASYGLNMHAHMQQSDRLALAPARLTPHDPAHSTWIEGAY